MERYKKASEGIHAPDELKRNVIETPSAARKRPPKAVWLGAAAAVLAVVLLVGVVPRLAGVGRTGAGAPDGAPAPGGMSGGAPMSSPASGEAPGSAPSSPPQAGEPGAGFAEAVPLAVAVYPENTPYPQEEDYRAADGSLDDAYFEAINLWWNTTITARQAQAPAEDGLAPFCAAALPEFLGNSGGENRVFSPLNVYLALSMLAETAGGNSRQQLLDLLDADSVEALRQRASGLWNANYRDDGAVTSILAASLWLNEDLAGAYHQDTLDTLARDYFASAFSGEMGSEGYNQALRSWINDQTGGLLSMDPDTVLALVSTVYFRANWADEFNDNLSAEGTFHAPGGDVTVTYLHQSGTGTYYWGEGFGVVRKDLATAGAMWFLLPDEGVSVDDLLASGAAAEFLAADKAGWQGQKRLKINLSVPKFDVSSDLDLAEGLKNLGVTDVFDSAVSDFTPLTDLPGLFVSEAEHAARVTLDEKGVEAAAFTYLGVAGGEPPLEDEIDFTLDRPFLFAIESATGQPLFVGVVNHP